MPATKDRYAGEHGHGTAWSGVVDRREAFQGAGRPVIRNLLFEVAGVLHDDSAWDRWLFQLLRRIGLHTHFRPFYRLWTTDYAGHSEQEFWQRLPRFLQACGLCSRQIDEVIAAGFHRRRQWMQSLRAFPGVRATLSRLCQCGVNLAVLQPACGPAAAATARLQQLGIDTFFDKQLDVSMRLPSELRAMKLRRALAAHGWNPAATAVVAKNSRWLDSATDCGMSAFAINYDPDASADRYLHCLAEIGEFVAPAARRAG